MSFKGPPSIHKKFGSVVASPTDSWLSFDWGSRMKISMLISTQFLDGYISLDVSNIWYPQPPVLPLFLIKLFWKPNSRIWESGPLFFLLIQKKWTASYYMCSEVHITSIFLTVCFYCVMREATAIEGRFASQSFIGFGKLAGSRILKVIFCCLTVGKLLIFLLQ